MAEKTPFVVDGCDIAHRALRPEVTAQVHAEFDDELRNATSWWQRYKIRRRIAQEIARRIDEKAPPEALY